MRSPEGIAREEGLEPFDLSHTREEYASALPLSYSRRWEGTELNGRPAD